MEAFLHLEPYPDVLHALKVLKSRELKLAFLSNRTERMLTSNIQHARLDGYFDHIISIDQAKSFKPAPSSYQLGIDVLGYQLPVTRNFG